MQKAAGRDRTPSVTKILRYADIPLSPPPSIPLPGLPGFGGMGEAIGQGVVDGAAVNGASLVLQDRHRAAPGATSLPPLPAFPLPTLPLPGLGGFGEAMGQGAVQGAQAGASQQPSAPPPTTVLAPLPMAGLAPPSYQTFTPEQFTMPLPSLPNIAPPPTRDLEAEAQERKNTALGGLVATLGSALFGAGPFASEALSAGAGNAIGGVRARQDADNAARLDQYGQGAQYEQNRYGNEMGRYGAAAQANASNNRYRSEGVKSFNDGEQARFDAEYKGRTLDQRGDLAEKTNQTRILTTVMRGQNALDVASLRTDGANFRSALKGMYGLLGDDFVDPRSKALILSQIEQAQRTGQADFDLANDVAFLSLDPVMQAKVKMFYEGLKQERDESLRRDATTRFGITTSATTTMRGQDIGNENADADRALKASQFKAKHGVDLHSQIGQAISREESLKMDLEGKVQQVAARKSDTQQRMLGVDRRKNKFAFDSLAKSVRDDEAQIRSYRDQQRVIEGRIDSLRGNDPAMQAPTPVTPAPTRAQPPRTKPAAWLPPLPGAPGFPGAGHLTPSPAPARTATRKTGAVKMAGKGGGAAENLTGYAEWRQRVLDHIQKKGG